MTKVGRNESCPCGSGKKYKSCCIAADDAETARTANLQAIKQSAYADAISSFKAMDKVEARIAELLKKGKFEQAEALAVQIADDHPDFPNGIERLADVFAARGDHAKAAELYEAASRFESDAFKPDAELTSRLMGLAMMARAKVAPPRP
jgi:hypothetical protein